jgi:hypothetical protein
MFKGLLELAHGALSAPVPACSCAKGLAVGVVALTSTLRSSMNGSDASSISGAGSSGDADVLGAGASCVPGSGHGWGSPAAGPASGGRMRPPARSGSGDGSPKMPSANSVSGGGSRSGSGSVHPELSAAFHSVDLDTGLPAHDVHALRTLMLHSSAARP